MQYFNIPRRETASAHGRSPSDFAESTAGILTDHQPTTFKAKELYHRPQREVRPESLQSLDTIEGALIWYARMSASGYKRTYSGQLVNVRFTPASRHSNGEISTVTSGCPLCPQKADIGEGIAGCPLMTQSGHSLISRSSII